MIEKKLIHQIPKQAEFHSAVLTTYSFDFHHFESQVLRPLKQKGVTSLNILADSNMLDKSIGFSTGHLKSICNHYSVHTIPCNAAFHPKIIFLAGENDVMFIQGSGNITTGGHGKNHELFGAYYVNTKDLTLLPLVQETWNYLKSLAIHVKGNGGSKLERIEKNCALLKNTAARAHEWNYLSDEISIAALYNEEKSGIWSQLIQLLPSKIKELQVISPYYDENGTTLKKFADQYGCTITAFLQKDKGIHPFKMVADERIKFLSWEGTDRSTALTKKYFRKLHSKIFWFKSGEDHYCLFGSPNCTVRAFGTMDYRGANDEFALLFKMKSPSWLEDLGLTGKFEPIIPQSNDSILKIEKELHEEQQKNANRIKILGVDQNEEKLTLYIKSTNYKEATIVVCNQWGDELERHQLKLDRLKIELKVDKSIQKGVAFVYLVDHDESIISNKQIVNTSYEYYNSDPSADNRNILKLKAAIEMGSTKLFDIVDYFNAIQTSTTTIKKETTKGGIKLKGEEKTEKQITSVSYKDSLEMERDTQKIEQLNRQHHSIQILDSIEKYFRDLAREEEEEDMDDEEDEATATTGRKRKEKKNRNPPVQLNSIQVLENRRKRLTKFLSNYDHFLDKALLQEKSGITDLANYLIVMVQVLDFSDRTVNLRVPEGGSEEKYVLFPVEGKYSGLSNLNSALFELIGKFLLLINQAPITSGEDQYSIKKIDLFKLRSKTVTLFTLATMRSKYTNNPKLALWYDTLGYNAIQSFGNIEVDFEEHLQYFSKDLNLKFFNKNETTKVLSQWKIDFENLDKNPGFFTHKKFGVCAITDSIPRNGAAKFYRLSRPGFSYNEDHVDFEEPKLYDIKNDKLMSSKQDFDAAKRDLLNH